MIMGPYITSSPALGVSEEVMYGPMIIYSLIHGTLKLVKEQISSFDKTKIELIQQIAAGKQKAAGEGPDVFEYLKNAVLKNNV